MDASGAKSQVAGITSAIVVMFVLLFLTPVFKNMPQNVQGAIVISAVIGLFNYSEWFFLWKVSTLRCACCAVLCCACFAGHAALLFQAVPCIAQAVTVQAYDVDCTALITFGRP